MHAGEGRDAGPETGRAGAVALPEIGLEGGGRARRRLAEEGVQRREADGIAGDRAVEGRPGREEEAGQHAADRSPGRNRRQQVAQP